jgi:hypothetical protein
VRSQDVAMWMVNAWNAITETAAAISWRQVLGRDGGQVPIVTGKLQIIYIYI